MSVGKLTKDQIVGELKVLQTTAEQAADDIEDLASANGRQASLDGLVGTFEKYVTVEIVVMRRDTAAALQAAVEAIANVQIDVEELTNEQIAGDFQALQALQASTLHVLQIAAECLEYLEQEQEQEQEQELQEQTALG